MQQINLSRADSVKKRISTPLAVIKTFSYPNYVCACLSCCTISVSV